MSLNQPIEYFKKSAKSLLASVKSGDTDAEERVRAIRGTSPCALTLMKAQHVIAVEFGFASWSKLLEADSAELYAVISRREKRRKFDMPTQRRVRELIRKLRIGILDEVLNGSIHILSIYPISGGVSASYKVAAATARRNAVERPWGIDIGSYQCMVTEAQARQLIAMCENEGIPFWQRRWFHAHKVLRSPRAFSREYSEICEQFGAPVTAADVA